MSVRYEDWLAENPGPELADLIAQYGAHSLVPANAWARFDKARSDWNLRRFGWTLDRLRQVDAPVSALAKRSAWKGG